MILIEIKKIYVAFFLKLLTFISLNSRLTFVPIEGASSGRLSKSAIRRNKFSIEASTQPIYRNFISQQTPHCVQYEMDKNANKALHPLERKAIQEAEKRKKPGECLKVNLKTKKRPNA